MCYAPRLALIGFVTLQTLVNPLYVQRQPPPRPQRPPRRLQQPRPSPAPSAHRRKGLVLIAARTVFASTHAFIRNVLRETLRSILLFTVVLYYRKNSKSVATLPVSPSFMTSWWMRDARTSVLMMRRAAGRRPPRPPQPPRPPPLRQRPPPRYLVQGLVCLATVTVAAVAKARFA